MTITNDHQAITKTPRPITTANHYRSLRRSLRHPGDDHYEDDHYEDDHYEDDHYEDDHYRSL